MVGFRPTTSSLAKQSICWCRCKITRSSKVHKKSASKGSEAAFWGPIPFGALAQQNPKAGWGWTKNSLAKGRIFSRQSRNIHTVCSALFLHPSFSVQNRPQLDKRALSSYDIDGSSKTGELLMDRCLPASGGDNQNRKFIANIINLQDRSAVPESCRKYRIGDAP